MLSLVAGFAAGLVSALLAAIGAAIVDIYLSGHGRDIFSRPWIDVGFVQLSRADVALLAVSTISALITGTAVYRGRQKIPEN